MKIPPFIASSPSKLGSFTRSFADFRNKFKSMNSPFQIFSFILTGMWDEMGSKTLEISDGTGQLADALQMNWQNFPSPVVKNVATYLSCYFQHPVSPGPVLEESFPAVVVLVEHPVSPGPLLEESFPAVVVFAKQLTLMDHMLKALIGWIHHTRDD